MAVESGKQQAVCEIISAQGIWECAGMYVVGICPVETVIAVIGTLSNGAPQMQEQIDGMKHEKKLGESSKTLHSTTIFHSYAPCSIA